MAATNLTFSEPDEVHEPSPGVHRKLARTTSRSMASMELALAWRCENARHTECYVARKLNLWRDIFPPDVEADLLDKPVGHKTRHVFEPGSVIPGYRQQDQISIESDAFRKRTRHSGYTEPRLGRFYPKGFIAGVRDYFLQDVTPFRIAGTGAELSVDLNHPLAGREVVFTSRILDAWEASDEHGGRCNDVIGFVSQNGPGMQARHMNQPTDFWSDMPFIRTAKGPDAEFYASPRFVDHIDSTATAQITRLYSRLAQHGGSVLDLMASWKTHLAPSLALGEVAGIGLNRDELEGNSLLGDKVVQDLNMDPMLPFETDRFDTVVCTVSVEYMTEPVRLFSEVRRVLKPGGRFIVTFSNRWFPPKVVKIWQDIHEFERPGLALEYFLKAGGFVDLETWSMRGLPRPVDDKYADRLVDSDPVYAVWGAKG